MYTKKLHLHFMGIAGIGMRGIAQILQLQGYTVSGCDTGGVVAAMKPLVDRGCFVDERHDAKNSDRADVLIYSSAIDKNHPEILAAQEKGIPVITRAIM